MDFGKMAKSFILIFALTLVVALAVTFAWNFIFHSTKEVDWDTSFVLAFIFGITLTWITSRQEARNRQ